MNKFVKYLLILSLLTIKPVFAQSEFVSTKVYYRIKEEF